MQNLFGEQSEDEEDEVNSEHEPAANPSDVQSDEGEGETQMDGEGEFEGQGEVELESEGEAHDVGMDQVESEGERVQSSPEKEVSGQKVHSEGHDAESEEEEFEQRVVKSRRREVPASESEGSEDNHYANNDNEDEVYQERNPRRSTEEPKGHEVVRDVFGDSDEDEPADYGVRNDVQPSSPRSPMEEEDNYEKDIMPEDMVPDEDVRYESENENLEQKSKDKPVGPPLDLEVALRPPPGLPENMNMIKVSNIMGIESKPFDPATFVEEDVFVTDESGANKRIRLEDNIVRYRRVKNRDGTTSYESNARFVQWSDGSIQLLIGNEVLDTSVQDAHHDHAHLFLRHGKGILQSQGRLLKKMRFMPSSLSSKSHRLLTALVDSRHKKTYKVKNCVTDIDPEKEKEEKEKVEGQNIRANQLLHRKRDKVSRKYAPTTTRARQLSPGFLEDALDEEEEQDDYSSRRPQARRRFEEDLEAEARAEKRIINAKAHVRKNVPSKHSSARPPRRPVDEYSESEREESEYETDGEDVEMETRGNDDDLEDEYEDEEVDVEPEGVNSASEEEEPRRKSKETGGHSLKHKEIDSDVDSPPRKAVNRRKAVVFDSDED